jgi:hypothetical protein
MEIIRKGSDKVFEDGPLTCCFPVGTWASRRQ